ncbi:MAG: hypothetical protein IT262_17745 [Saprospiraceae bacterium]|nr:hypothetical protein [Saprospiraceae bacterium]
MRRFFTIWTLSLLSISILHAQFFPSKLGVRLGLNVGASRLYHDIDFQSTVVNADFQRVEQYVEEAFEQEGIEYDYTWENYAKANKLRDSYIQPRFGFSLHVTYGNVPAFLIVDAMSSTSGYERMAYSGTLGLGKDFEIGDNIGLFLTCMGGYKLVWDKGFGDKTIVNSFGDKFQREKIQQYFGAKEPLGSQRGNLFALRLGLGKEIGEAGDMSAGLEGYGELDLTDRIQRQARMTNVGIQAYFRFKLLGNKKEADNFYPNPAGGRKN